MLLHKKDVLSVIDGFSDQTIDSEDLFTRLIAIIKNPETLESISESRQGTNVNSYNSPEEGLKALGF